MNGASGAALTQWVAHSSVGGVKVIVMGSVQYPGEFKTFIRTTQPKFATRKKVQKMKACQCNTDNIIHRVLTGV